jgi:zinc/manganese transport system permease protein
VVLVIGLMASPALLALLGATSLRQVLLRAALIGMVLSGGGFLLAIQPWVNLPPGPLIGVLCLLVLPLRRFRLRACL